MSNDVPSAADRGSELSDGLGHEQERAAFARWCRENGHGELDDMLMPLDHSLRELMWPVWQGGRMEGIRSVQEQTAVIVRAALELLESVEGNEPFTAEKMRAFKRVFGA